MDRVMPKDGSDVDGECECPRNRPAPSNKAAPSVIMYGFCVTPKAAAPHQASAASVTRCAATREFHASAKMALSTQNGTNGRCGSPASKTRVPLHSEPAASATASAPREPVSAAAASAPAAPSSNPAANPSPR